MKQIDFSYNNTIDNSIPTLSISSVLGMLGKPFDSREIAEKTHNKHFNNPDSQYYQKTVDQIIDMWEEKGAESRHYGCMLDDYIGLNLNEAEDTDMMLWKLDNDYDNDNRLKNVCTSFDHFLEKIKEYDIEYIDREQTVYYPISVQLPGDTTDHQYYIKGRLDALFYDTKRNKYIIVDWKSSNTIDKQNRWEKLLGPMKHLDACNWNTYTLQGYFYKTALIEHYLPEGTQYDDVEFRIVQLPGHILENGLDYEIHKPAFNYDKQQMDNLYKYAVLKNILQKKSEA